MSINLQPYHKKGYLCIEDNIACIAELYKKNHIFMHTAGLNFYYAPKIVKGEEVLKQIRTSCNFPANKVKDFATELDYLKDFVGLDIRLIPGLPKSELIKMVKACIEKQQPVAVISNTYHVPWNEQYYKKVDKLHSFLVIDVDIDLKYLLCIDGYLADKPVRLPFYDLMDFTDLLIFKPIKPRKVLSFPHIISQIINCLLNNQKLDNCNCIRWFADDVVNIRFSQTEKKHYSDLDYSDFMVGLKSIEFGRKNFGELIYFLSDEFADHRDLLLLIGSKIELLTEQWRLVIVFFVKAFYSGQTAYYMRKAAEQLYVIADDEEEVTRLIASLIP